MVTAAHSNIFEMPTTHGHRRRYRSAEEIALERWGAKERRIAQSVVAILTDKFEGDWHWEISDNFLGTPADSEIIIGTNPNGDGTHTKLELIGWPMELLAEILPKVEVEMRRPKTHWEVLLEPLHWMDRAWGPLPLPYYLKQSIEEAVMSMKSLENDMKEVLQRLTKIETRITTIEVTGKVLAWVCGILVGLLALVLAIAEIFGGERVAAALRALIA